MSFAAHARSAFLLLLLAAGCRESPTTAAPDPYPGPPYLDPRQEVATRVTDLLSRMTLEEKLGQMTQVARTSITDEDLTAYHIGSVLSGAPASNTAADWADLSDRSQQAAMRSRLGIPLLYGTDAVHGHNNLRGATIFPHNIGLGATRDPDLLRRIGEVTAVEVAGTGVNWNFAPCLCVVRNVRWGRTYESYGEDPEIATAFATIIDGLQGPVIGRGPTSILATAKHYIGDGGTHAGQDQGDARISEAELRRVHLPPFAEAVRRNVGSVMITYSAWNGEKVHGHRYLITDVLREELGFEGIVLSDWAGIDQIDGMEGISAEDVRAAINAGIDMVMVPHDYTHFLGLLRQEVEAGRIPMARVDDAVRRILWRKFELGVFERPFTERVFTAQVGRPEHRALAREAVRRSLVLLKNDGVLPLASGSRIFVAGRHADDIGLQSGGWTIEWQGAPGPITPGTTILEGIRDAAPAGTVTYSVDGEGTAGHDVALVVVGEQPYAEYLGDRGDALGLDEFDLATLARVEAAGIPVVVVLVSGRPLVITDQLPRWSALVAAWLPGSEGDGVADVLFGRHAPTGRLPVGWPRASWHLPFDPADPDGQPLFPYGFGLSYP